MRNRWITLLGRIGSILIAVALALILLSSFSPNTLREYPILKFTSRPEKYNHVTSGVYMPHEGCRILTTSNESLQIYFLAMRPENLTNWMLSWISEHFPSLNATQVLQTSNASVLEAFLQARPEDVLLKEVMKGERSIDFFPPEATNVTVMVSNPSLMTVDVSVKMSAISTRVPRRQTTTSIGIFAAFGAALVLPKIIEESKRRRKARSDGKNDKHA